MHIKSFALGLLLAGLFNIVFSADVLPRQSCSAGYSLCSPPGSTSNSTYDTGDSLLALYSILLDTVNPQAQTPETTPQSTGSNGPTRRDNIDIICCASGLSCLLLQIYNVPLCYDKFTTDFALPNGDYGTVSNGSLITSSDYRINLITGDYTMPSGQTGNIYSNAGSEKPNTATLLIPTQFTSSGVGSMVPASQLGSSVSYANVPTITISASNSASSTSFMSTLSLSGPPVTPCSTCCIGCGSLSTTVNATAPTTVSHLSTSIITTSVASITSIANTTNIVLTTTEPGSMGGADVHRGYFAVNMIAVVAGAAVVLG